MPLILTSAAFEQGGDIPRAHCCEGADRSPPFVWSGAPDGTKCFVLVCDDPDAPGGVFRHWAAYNIPGDWRGLQAGYGPETLEPGFSQAINDFGKPGYGGPCPPKGDKPHAYHFRLSALSAPIVSAGPGATCVEVQRLARPLEIEAVELVGYYQR